MEDIFKLAEIEKQKQLEILERAKDLIARNRCCGTIAESLYNLRYKGTRLTDKEVDKDKYPA